jgi:eukaryotic-like serine/threonine-protein kinase
MSDTPRQPTVFNDRYELHRKLARGGMADVYLARDQLLDRPVAVKVLFSEYAKDETFVERFRREARAAANLNHPNIVAIYDWGQQYGTYFIVMEYVEGRTLSEIIRTEGPLHPNRAAEVTADVAAALAFAHRNGVIHRDIKPGNILITSTGQVKVADFGIAQALTAEATQANLTQVGAVMGTATYFSPEQAQGKPADPRSDLYSLGCVLYEMLTSRPPFNGETPVAIAYKHVQEQPPAPSSVAAGVPESLEAIELKLLAKDPADRYPSAEDLRTDLRRFLEGRPVAALGAASVGAMVGAAAGTGIADATQALPATTVGAGGVPPGTGAQDAYVAPDGTPPNKRSGAFLAVLIILLLVLAGLLVFVGLQLRKSSDQVTVPDVTSLNVLEATSRLEDAGFKVETTLQANADAQKDTVFKQNPTGGSKADKGGTVTLFVSTGVAQVAVPNVVGRTEAAARSLIENQNLVPDVKNQADPTTPIGQVISQNPPPDTMVEKGSAVEIVVSGGPAKVAVPGVGGLSVDDATNALTQAGFKVNQSSDSSPSVPKGNVIGTRPAAGTQADEGSTVTIIVSTGPAPTTTTSSSTTTSSTTTSTSSTTTTAPP